MCLAIVKPAGIALPEDHIRQGWQYNNDGGGYGFVTGGRAQIRKGFMKLKEYMEAYKADAEKHPDSAFLLHFRIGTDGALGPENTHPFRTDDGILIHNGVLSGTGSQRGVGPSDTALFVDMFKSDLSYDFVLKNKMAWDAATWGSKLAILYDDGRYQIINETSGMWVDGVWYSNSSYKPYGTGACSTNYNWYED